MPECPALGGGVSEFGSKPDSTKPYDQRSYDAGFHDGWADTCNRIDSYKDSIGKALKQAGIC